MMRLDALTARFRVQHEPQRTERRVELATLALALLLLVQLAWLLLRMLLPPAPTPIEPTDASLTVADRIAGRLLDTAGSAELRERPLFWEGRRPLDDMGPLEPEVAEEKVSRLQGIKLLGIFGVGEVGGIIVRFDGKQQRLAVGEEIKGWTLQSMDTDGATLSSASNGIERLALERSLGSSSVQAEPSNVSGPGAAGGGAQGSDAEGLDELTLGGSR